MCNSEQRSFAAALLFLTCVRDVLQFKILLTMSTEVDKTLEERDILYELFIYSEWVQEPELVTKFGYGDDSLRRLTPEAETHFRCLSWSPDSSLLAVGSPSGRVEMFDLAGGLQYSLENDNPLAALEGAAGGHALVDMLWTRTDNTKRTQWSYELVLVSYNGQVRSYLVNSESYSPAFTLDIPLRNGSSIGSVVYHPGYSLLLIGEGSLRQMDHADVNDPTLVAEEAGLSAWKFLSEKPYLEKLATIYQDTTRGGIFSSMLTYFRVGCEDAVLCLAVSPSGKQLLCLHSSSTISLWSLPGLILTRVWQSFELPAFETTNPYLPDSECQLHQKTRGFWDVITVQWWNEQTIVIVRRAGSICVMSLESKRNLLGDNPEWFGLAPRLAAIDTQEFLTLECEWQMGLSRTRANSSFIGSELENSLLKEDVDNEDSTNTTTSPSWVRWLLGFGPLRRTLEYVADMDFGDDAKPRRVVKIYRLLGVKATSPSELFSVKIENGEYEEALSLAARYDLDPDPVFQRQWHRAEPCKANIDAYLHRVSDRQWVLNECLNQLPSDAVSCRELFLYGIRITNVFFVAGTKREDIADKDIAAEEAMRKKIIRDVLRPERLTQYQKWILECRRKLLIYLEALKIYESFNNTFSSTEFGWFREQSVLSVAIHYARDGKADPVFELLIQYSNQLAHHWLPLLTQFPETISPDIYAKILPYASSKPPYSIRKWQPGDSGSEPDWAENLVPCPFVEEWESTEREFYEENPETVQWQCAPGKQPNYEMVSQWYLSRAKMIEEFTMLTENALDLVRLACQKLHPKGDLEKQLTQLKDNLTSVKMMAFDCGMEFVTLRDIENKSFAEQLHLIMANANDSSYSTCFREWLLPFIERCERSCPGAKLELLKGHLTEQAAHNMDRVLRVWDFLTAADGVFVTHSVIGDLDHRVEIALACIEASREHEQLQLCHKLLSLLPTRPRSATNQINSLYDRLGKLSNRVDTAQFFGEYGTELNLAQVAEIEQDGEAIHDILGKMFRRLSKKSPCLDHQDWICVAKNCHGFLKKVLPALDLDRCFELMCQALLSSTNHDNIHIAKGLMNIKTTISAQHQQQTDDTLMFPYRLSPTISHRLVLHAACDYVDSATSSNDPSVSLATACLSLIGDTDLKDLGEDIKREVQKELDLIQALPLLSKLGVQSLPIYIRSADKMKLIQEALVCNKTNYRSFNKINQLAQYLGVYKEEGPTAVGTILSMVAEIAQREGDLNTALSLCQRIVHGEHVSGWKACARLASCDDLKRFDERQKLIDFCVVHAPSQHLYKLIEQKNNIQHQQYYHSLEQKYNSRQEISLSSFPADAVDTAKQFVSKVIPIVAQTVKGAVKVVGPSNSPLEDSTLKNNKQAYTERETLTKWSVPAFYSGLWGEETLHSRLSSDFHAIKYTEDIFEESSISSRTYSLPQLATVMHFAAVNDRINGTKSVMSINDDMLLSLASEYLADDVLLALGHLLQLRDVRRAEELFLQQLPYTRHCLQLGGYTFALATISRETQEGHIKGDVFVKMSRDELIKHIESLECHSEDTESLRVLVSKFHQLEADLCRAELVQQQSGGTVDVGRFGHDEQYKRDTILGMALCEDLETLRVALNLARHYDVPEFDVCLGHLEHLFRSATDPSAIEARLQEEIIEKHLKEDKSALWHTLRQKIYPVLRGTNYDVLKVYYHLLLSCSQRESDKKRIEAYMMLLETVNKKLDGVDFKRLISSNTEEQRASLLEVIDEMNIDEVIRVCGRFKSLLHSISRSTVLQLYLKNEFIAAGDRSRTELKDLFKKHLKHIRYLDPDDVLDFIIGVCFDPFVAAYKLNRGYRLEILKSFLAFTKSMAKKAAESSAGPVSPSRSSSEPVTVSTDRSDQRVPINSWEELQTRLAGFLQHLQKIEDGFVNELLNTAENPRLAAYVDMFEMTAGEKIKLEELLMHCALQECDPGLLECLLSICPSAAINYSPSEIFLRATRLVVDRLVKEATSTATVTADNHQNHDSSLPKRDPIQLAFQTRKPISIMRRLLKTGAKLSSNKNSFDRAVVELVRPFCLDKAVTLSSRLEVLRLLKECVCMVKPEDEAIRLHLETLALLQEQWSDISVESEETASAGGRLALFSRLLDAAENSEQFDTLASLLQYWPAFDECVLSPWLSLLLKMPSLASASGATFLNLVEIARKYHPFTIDDIYQLEHAWADRLTPTEKALFLLESDETECHSRALDIVHDLKPGEITDGMRDRLLKLGLTPDFVDGPHYAGLLDRLVQKPDFEAVAESTVDSLAAAGMIPEAASLVALTDMLPSALQSFTGALSLLAWKRGGYPEKRTSTPSSDANKQAEISSKGATDMAIH
ncbi:neuroblastoma-amplified sequence-like isoform X2 [Varroa destructor]|uniref:Neuroblastoma-amplified sequence N-terminal domain-containing protein n=1 Tax=Varroa destructor TaxID=109461 RepID=A0A7M7MEY2_VARDE|nr:neuroblastoma-amplified sequence-like isoform X2 [Varroa destructor]